MLSTHTQPWFHPRAAQGLLRQRQKNCHMKVLSEFQDSLGYAKRPCLKTKQNEMKTRETEVIVPCRFSVG